MGKYIIRLDDACEKWNKENWIRIEKILDKYHVKPLVGVIPCCKDPMMEIYAYDENFWQKIDSWKNKGWVIALHGCNHVYTTKSGGLNPVNARSEFAGEPLEIQEKKIAEGIAVLKMHGIEPEIFIAPSHTFDENTLIALKNQSKIRIISDTVANNVYRDGSFIFIPQQCGKARGLPFKIVTFCYHPNTMVRADYEKLENFLRKNRKKFVADIENLKTEREKTAYDKWLSYMYFNIRKMKRKIG